MKVVLLSLALAILHVTLAAESQVTYGKIEFEKSFLTGLIKDAAIPCKPEALFTADLGATVPDKFKIDVGQRLYALKKGLVKDPNLNTSVSLDEKIEIKLPKDKTLDDYVAFIATPKSSGICESYTSSSFKDDFASALNNNELAFASKQVTGPKHQSVCVNVIEFERMLLSNFDVSNKKLVDQPSRVQEIKSFMDSMFFKLSYESGEFYVYLPSNQTLEEFKAFVKSQVDLKYDISLQTLIAALTALKRKSETNVRKVHLDSWTSVYSSIGDEIVSSDKKEDKISIPTINIIGLENLEKIYLDFGSLPVRDGLSNNCDILKDMIKSLMPQINEQVKIEEDRSSTFAKVASWLMEDQVKLKYEETFVDGSLLQPIKVTVKELNDAIVKQMNSIKIALSVSYSYQIILPPETEFTSLEKENGRTTYSHDKFPTDKSNILCEFKRLTAYIEFVKGKVNSEKKEKEVLDEFFQHFWAQTTVDEFSKKFADLVDFVKQEEQAEITRREQKEDATIKLNNKKNGDITNDSSSNKTSPGLSKRAKIVIVVFCCAATGAIIGGAILYVRRRKRKNAKLRTLR